MATAFREMQERDIGDLLRMMAALYQQDVMPFQPDRARSAMLRLAESPRHGHLWLLEWSGQTAGYLALTFGYSLEYGGEYAFIDELFVDEPYRGRGIGSAAMQHAADVCKARHVTALLLEADLQNSRATALYRRLGFEEHRRRLMSLPIS